MNCSFSCRRIFLFFCSLILALKAFQVFSVCFYSFGLGIMLAEESDSGTLNPVNAWIFGWVGVS